MSRSSVLGAFLKLRFRPNRFSIHKSLLKSPNGAKFVSMQAIALKKSGWVVYPKAGFFSIQDVKQISI